MPTYYGKIHSMHSIVVSTSLLSDIEAAVSKHLHGVDYKIQYICTSKDKQLRHYTSLKELGKCDKSLERSIAKIVMKISADNDTMVNLVFGKLCTVDAYPFLSLEGIIIKPLEHVL